MSKKPEDMLQKACVKWTHSYFALKHPKLMIELETRQKKKYWVAPIVYTKNEGNKSIGQAMEDKRMGLSSGYCDLTLHINNGTHTALIIELKSRAGHTRKNQHAWQNHLKEQGAQVHTNVRTLDAYIKIVMEYMKGLK